MKEINVLGFGLMGKQIAGLLCLLGYRVNVWNHREKDISLIDKFIEKNEQNFGNKKGSVCFVSKLLDLPDVITIEALIEDIEIKRKIFFQLNDHLKSGYFTSTSSFSPSEIDSSIGVLHFFNPIRMKLIEFMPSRTINVAAMNLVSDLEKLGFTVANVKDNRCFLGNYILFHEFSSFFKLIERYKYSFQDVQRVVFKLYNERDILKIIDIVGIDVTLKIMNNIKEDEHDFYVPKLLKNAADNNVLGYKNNTSIKDYLLSRL